MQKKFLILAGTLGMAAVMLGAFGAHRLKPFLAADEWTTFHTGVEYHFYHVFAILAVALLAGQEKHKTYNTAGWLFALGIVFFSGSLYLLACRNLLGLGTGWTWLGPVTPIGGTFFIFGWLMLVIKAVRTLE